MKITVVMMLLFVAFSAVALAEKSVERAALDLVIARGDCGWIFDSCEKHSDCCQADNWVCSKRALQKEALVNSPCLDKKGETPDYSTQ
uniref:U24-Sparatoxin-Hju1be_1 n=1 Tax=Heteropoda jugulans TaxID=1358901 RepID=A0A4Q8K6Y6_9ARAC